MTRTCRQYRIILIMPPISSDVCTTAPHVGFTAAVEEPRCSAGTWAPFRPSPSQAANGHLDAPVCSAT